MRICQNSTKAPTLRVVSNPCLCRLERLSRIMDEAGVVLAEYHYLGPGRVLSRKSANGVNASYAYDDAGRVTGLNHVRDGELVAGFAYAYNPAGRLFTTLRNHRVATSDNFELDSLYRVVELERGELNDKRTRVETPAEGVTEKQVWDVDGVNNWRRTNVTRDGVTVAHERTHNAVNQLVVEEIDGELHEYVYDRNGNLVDDGTQSYQWDYANRLRQVVRIEDGQTIAKYEYDAFNRRVSKEVTNVPGQDGFTRFFHDGQHEVEEWNGTVAESGVVARYVYGKGVDEVVVMDRFSPPLPATLESVSGVPVHDAVEEAEEWVPEVTVEAPDVPVGKVVTVVVATAEPVVETAQSNLPPASQVVVTTVQGVVMPVVDSTVQTVEFGVETIESAPSTLSGTLEEVVVAVDDAVGQTACDLPTDSCPAVRARYYFHQDQQKSVYAVTNEAGQVKEGYLYDAYGAQTILQPGSSGEVSWSDADLLVPEGASAIGNPLLFTGRRFDAETGLYQYRARYYDSHLGRFISQDPLGLWGDAANLGNGYAYTGNDPIDRTDPTGMHLCYNAADSCNPYEYQGSTSYTEEECWQYGFFFYNGGCLRSVPESFLPTSTASSYQGTHGPTPGPPQQPPRPALSANMQSMFDTFASQNSWSWSENAQSFGPYCGGPRRVGDNMPELSFGNYNQLDGMQRACYDHDVCLNHEYRERGQDSSGTPPFSGSGGVQGCNAALQSRVSNYECSANSNTISADSWYTPPPGQNRVHAQCSDFRAGLLGVFNTGQTMYQLIHLLGGRDEFWHAYDYGSSYQDYQGSYS